MTAILYILFFIASLLLIFIILLQEGKGGGIADAFGGAGAQTFGVRAGGVNRVTMVLFAIFVLAALGISWLSGDPNDSGVMSGQFNDPPATITPATTPPEGQ